MRRLADSAFTLALWIIVVGTVVFAAVFVGWWLIFKPVVPHPLIAIAIALGLAVIALLLARFFAEKLAESREADAPPIRPYHYLAYLFLFMISAMGTINAAFVLWEGPSVVRQDMTEVRNAYTSLEVYAGQALVSSAQERKTRDLDRLLANLHEEIVNPNDDFCGVGQGAERILGDVRQIVPRMPAIRGAGPIRPCDRAVAERLYQSYAASARATLASDPAYLAFSGPEKRALLASLTRNVTQMRTSFDRVEGLLGDPTAFARSEVQRPLATAAANYRDDYRRVAARQPPPADSEVPDSVDVTQSQELGSFAAFFEILISRILDPKTWVYLLIAILLDIGLVYFLTQAFVRYRRRRSAGEMDPYRLRGPRPKFLWINPMVDATRVEVRHV